MKWKKINPLKYRSSSLHFPSFNRIVGFPWYDTIRIESHDSFPNAIRQCDSNCFSSNTIQIVNPTILTTMLMGESRNSVLYLLVFVNCCLCFLCILHLWNMFWLELTKLVHNEWDLLIFYEINLFWSLCVQVFLFACVCVCYCLFHLCPSLNI